MHLIGKTYIDLADITHIEFESFGAQHVVRAWFGQSVPAYKEFNDELKAKTFAAELASLRDFAIERKNRK